MIPAFVIDLLGVIVRWAITVFGTWLVHEHIMSAGQADTFMADLVQHTMLALPAALALVWGLWAKYRSRKTLVTAVANPELRTEAAVKAFEKSGAVTPTVWTPKNTEPGIPVPTSVPSMIGTEAEK